jgi:hypothetical protein
MKKSFLIIPLSLVIFCSVIRCKKDEPINIVLYDKPLETIQQFIQGRWKLVFGEGGICGICIFPCDNCYVEFTSDNRFISKSFVITTDTTKIHWVKDIGEYLQGDSTYIMEFVDYRGYPGQFVIQQIYYDTLIFYDNASDPMFYHCVRSN